MGRGGGWAWGLQLKKEDMLDWDKDQDIVSIYGGFGGVEMPDG